MIKDKILRKRYRLWREIQGNSYWRSPLRIEDNFVIARYSPGTNWVNEEVTDVLAFPPGCQAEGEKTASTWQKHQLPQIPSCSSYVLFEFLLGGEPSWFLDPEVGINKSYTVGAGHYVTLVLEEDRTLMAYPTPQAFEEMDDILKMPPIDAAYYLFEDLQGSTWELDFSGEGNYLTDDGVFYPDINTDDGSYWMFGWKQHRFVYDLLHESILLGGRATFSYFMNEPPHKSLAQEVAEACGVEVIIP